MFYAKSLPVETIEQHTRELLIQLELLRESYGTKIGMDDSFWDMLRVAVLFHDMGKCNSVFQNKIRKARGETLLPCAVPATQEIPHNYVSVAFLPYRSMTFSKQEWRLLVEAIGYHHERDALPNRKDILAFAERTIAPETKEIIFRQMGLEYSAEPSSGLLLDWLEKQRGTHYVNALQDPAFRRTHILLKGFLHRLDHAASAHVQVESGVAEHAGEKTKRFLLRKYKLRPAQQFAAEHADRNVIMTASTGIGKTEASLLWIDGDKAFITLPLRVSLNAMFDRLQSSEKTGLEHLGLLHSSSLDYLFEKDTIDAEETYRVSRQLSQKVTLTTIDQVLKFPFLYKGFEKELATFSYSKLVIDEIQAYDPTIAAMLIRALEMVVEMGGKFMVMTATLPKLYLETIRKRGKIPDDQWVHATFPDDELQRHRFAFEPAPLTELSTSLILKAKRSKILVICNTVDKAIEVYEALMDESKQSEAKVPVWLLHSRFIKKHKSLLEQRVTQFAGSGWHLDEGEAQTGIWVTTQIVEASLDVDFDELYTELCPLDSLFQRMGRCYRVRPYADEQPNIHILTSEPSGVPYVYDERIVEMSLCMLQSYAGKLMLESDKMKLVEQLYSREKLKDTAYLNKFESAMHLFSHMSYFEMKSADAQQLLRDIRTQEVIPWRFASAIREWQEKSNTEENKELRRVYRREIEKYAVAVNERSLRYQGIAPMPLDTQGVEYLRWIMDSDAEYDFDEETLQGCGLMFVRGTDIL